MKDWIIGIGVLAVVVAVIFIAMFSDGWQLPGTAGGANSISDVFHAVLDPLDPAWESERRAQCEMTNGEWKDSSSALGCFGMDSGTFDPLLCTSALAVYMQEVCERLPEAEWVCSSTNIGCRY